MRSVKSLGAPGPSHSNKTVGFWMARRSSERAAQGFRRHQIAGEYIQSRGSRLRNSASSLRGGGQEHWGG
jgi:hypothetical protein